MPQPAHRAIDEDFFMGIRAAPRRSFTPKQTDVVIRVPASAPPPAPQISNDPRERVTAVTTAIACQRLENLITQWRRNPLVRVHEQHPFLGGLRMGESLLLAVTRPLTLDESVGIEPANIRCSIRTVGIHHNDLGAPSEALKAGFDSLLLVKTNDNRGNVGRSYFAA